ncbi:TM2 domain-containing protein [Roseovarius aquimarinus]|uniref:TM2 domain-containing protein n=1 Tax=Roseovarius aquimarinus TaxID=1229156 RepID=A0ABW7IBF1_9RHOB
MQHSTERSPKSYGTAVLLCGIFGILGIHHFYLEDWLHGLADVGLLILAIGFAAQGMAGLALFVLMLDALHTIVIFYYLIIEKWRDGKGRPVLMPSTS